MADRSMATQLFKEGRALLEEGRIGPACRKLEESQRLDPGGGTLLNLALCHEQEGRSASAWVEFTEALGVAKRDNRPQRVEFARMHIASLEPLLSRLVIEVPPTTDLPDLEIRRDGSLVGRAVWGSPVPVDPGDHLVEATAPGKIAWKRAVSVGARSDTKTLAVASLDDQPQDVAAAPAPAPLPPASRAPAPLEVPAREPAADSHHASGGSAWSWIALGVGVAAAGVGTYFVLNALSLKDNADRDCPGDRCTAQGAGENADAIRSANVATASFATSAVGLGLGAILLAVHAGERPPEAASARPGLVGGFAIAPGSGQATLAGRW